MSRAIKDIGWLVLIITVLIVGITVFEDRKYVFISLFIALASCGMVYCTYDRRKGGIRRMVVIAIMVAIADVGRFIFAPVPGFTPVSAIVIVSSLYLGAESGFIIGSLAALTSDMIFGIGPWTPFQMCAWGGVGMIAGLPVLKKYFSGRIPLMLYGAFAGVVYSAIMDIWTVLAVDGCFNYSRYVAAFITSLPFIYIYMISNVIFLAVLYKPIGKKLIRMNKKHCIF